MPTPLRRRLRLAQRGFWYAVAVVLVCMAVVLGVASQVLPLAEQHPERIATWLSQRAGRTVAFDHVETEWTRRGPLLRLDGLRIGDGGGVRIGEAEMLVSMYAGLLPGRAFTELRLRGVSLTLQRADDGKWSVQGLPGQQSGGDPLESLEGLGELQVIGGKLAIIAPALGWNVRVPDIDLRLRVDGDRVRAGVRALAREGGKPLHASLDFDREQGSGRAYLHGKPADLGDWSPLLAWSGVRIASGQGRAEGWVRVHRHRVVMATADIELQDVALARSSSERIAFQQVAGRLRWRLREGGWRLDAPTLRIGMRGAEASGPQKLDGLLIAGGKDYALQAQRIEAAPLFAVLALSDFVDAGMRRWLFAARPDAQVSKLALRGAGDILSMHGHLDRVAFAAVGDAPGITGLAGEFDGDREGFALRFDPQARLRFDWPRGFGVVHDVALRGDVAGWREGAGWRFATPGLRVQGKDYAADARGGLWFQGDGTRPWIDLAAELDDAPVAVAKGFWVHHRMPEAAVEWLNGALIDGRVSGGRALVSGDLDDWPFTANNGRFEATGRLVDGRLKFQPDWPMLERTDADITFIGNGFSVAGKGALRNVDIANFEAGIADFKETDLRIAANASADAAQLLDLLRNSPLQKSYGDAMSGLSVGGPVRADFALLQPLRKANAARKELRGTVELQGVALADSRWKLAFDDARGELNYDEHGFVAEGLAVRREGKPGELSLRAGGGVKDARNAFEAETAANFGADELLDRAPELDWLKPYVDGRSKWSVGVVVPKGQAVNANAAQLNLRSDLVGTALALPAPLEKPAAALLATTVRASLPVEKGDVEVAFGKRLALRARSANGQTGVRVALGSERVSEAPPASGLIASGRAGTLDALGWIGFAAGGSNNGNGGGKLPLRQIDVSADHLLMIGSDFPDTRVQVVPNANALAVSVQGPALSGAVSVPNADGARISGKLERLHWRAPRPATGSAPSSASAPAQGSEYNPAAIPPLAFDIGDLRFGDAKLGSAQLRTAQTATGLQIERLELRAPKQKIDIHGGWTGRGTAARTQLVAQVDSQDIGVLLDNLGIKRRVGGGSGQMQLDAAWPGGPAQFSLSALRGSLDIAARNGQLLEIEPGAGRVLGLLSVAQLPRRLMLDFRDFFNKGFAFNRIDGRIAFGDGIARSDDLSIDGPAAEIRIRGRTDLRAQQFDQTIDVQPKSGNLLTVVGAVAGGPLGAAVGAAANAVLRKPLGELGAKTYRVTGPWKDPKVEVVSREQSRVQREAASHGAAD